MTNENNQQVPMNTGTMHVESIDDIPYSWHQTISIADIQTLMFHLFIHVLLWILIYANFDNKLHKLQTSKHWFFIFTYIVFCEHNHAILDT